MAGLTPTHNTQAEKAQQVKDFLLKSKLDQSVLSTTLPNIKATGITPLVLLEQSKKLIKISRKEEEADDRDNLKFNTFLGAEDFVEEAIKKDNGKLQQKALLKIRSKRNLDSIHSGFFTPQLKSTWRSALAQQVDNSSPLEYVSVSNKITKLGPGGIQDTSQVSMASRQVNPSSFGFEDQLQLTESMAMGVTLYQAQGTRKGSDGKLYKYVMNNKTKKMEWVDHETLLNSVVEIPNFSETGNIKLAEDDSGVFELPESGEWEAEKLQEDAQEETDL